MTYLEALTQAMTEIGADPRALFLGQAVAYPGTGMTATFSGVPRDRLIELPVAEDMQLGLCTGLSLAGYLPVSIYPRVNFLLLAMSQLVLHLDKLSVYSDYRPKVIIRTAIASPTPLDPGPQHLGDYAVALRGMLTRVSVVKLTHPLAVLPEYRRAADPTNRDSTLIIEYVDKYGDEA